MHQRRIPEWLRHRPTPSVRGFALIAGLEAVTRGILISVFPLVIYRALNDARVVSEAYFLVGIASLAAGLLVPWLARFVPRRLIYITGSLMFVAGAAFAIQGTPTAVLTALALNTFATVVCFVCFNAYVLDFVVRNDLGQCETSRMFYSALGWTLGPATGVILMDYWAPAPFVISGVAALAMLALFLYMRLGNGRLITKSRKPPPNPLAFLPRFLAQPRLVAGWLFAVLRSCGWWVYVVYLPIFCVEAGLGDRLGGIVLSITNGTLFLTPFMLRWMKARSIRLAVRSGFLIAGILFSTATAVTFLPWLSVAFLMAGSFFLILLDVSAGLPFLLAVKPSERTEMSAVYASYRDVSSIATPGAAWFVLLVAPVSGIFVAGGLALIAGWALAANLNPRLGQDRIRFTPTQPTTVTAGHLDL